MRRAAVLSVFVSGPSDTGPYKRIVADAVYRWSNIHGGRHQVALTPVMWERDSTPEMGDGAQNILNRQIVDDSDLMIALFNARLGTPTDAAESGTAEEIDRFLKADKPVSVLFHSGPGPAVGDLDSAQIAALQAFKRSCQGKGLLGDFDSPSTLSEVVERVLTKHVQRILGTEGATSPSQEDETREPNDSKRALDAGKKGGTPPLLAAWRLLEKGELDKGMEALRTAWEGNKASGSITWLGAQALGLAHAFQAGGSDEAFERLAELANNAPGADADLSYFYASALETKGMIDEALVRYREAISLDVAENVGAVADVLRIESSRGRAREAMEEVRALVARQSDRKTKAAMLRAVAGVLKGETAQEDYEATLLFELALEFNPTDDDERFKLARRYGEEEEGAAFAHFHFRTLTARSDDPVYATNAGWQAQQLNLPILAVRTYQTALEKLEPYAVSNIASGLLAAGFADRAREVIESARKQGLSHPLVDKTAGNIVVQEEQEDERLTSLTEAVKNVREWRIREARALLENSPSAQEVSGPYSSEPAHGIAFLQTTDGVYVNGTFHYQPGSIATLQGELRGRWLRFAWQSVPQDSAVGAVGSAFLQNLLIGLNSSGFGSLIWEGDGRFTGYWTRGVGPLTEKKVDHVTKWTLQRTEGSLSGGVPKFSSAPPKIRAITPRS